MNDPIFLSPIFLSFEFPDSNLFLISHVSDFGLIEVAKCLSNSVADNASSSPTPIWPGSFIFRTSSATWNGPSTSSCVRSACRCMRVNGDDLVSWPRVNAECKFRAPLSFEDELDVHLLVREKRSKSVTYEFRFYKQGDESLVAVGSITVVSVSIDRATGRMTSIPIPESIDRLIEVAPGELFEEK